MPDWIARNSTDGEREDDVGSAHMAAEQFNFRAEPALLNRAKEEADLLGMTVAEFIRQAIMFRIAFLVTKRGDADRVEQILRELVNGGEE